MQLYAVVRTRAGHTLDYYEIRARSGLEAIVGSRRDDLNDLELTIHAFALGEKALHGRDATRIKGQLVLLG